MLQKLYDLQLKALKLSATGNVHDLDKWYVTCKYLNCAWHVQPDAFAGFTVHAMRRNCDVYDVACRPVINFHSRVSW